MTKASSVVGSRLGAVVAKGKMMDAWALGAPELVSGLDGRRVAELR